MYTCIQDQFVFVHDAINELVLCGDTEIAANDIRDKVKSLHKIRPGGDVVSEFQLQFQVILSLVDHTH